MEYGPKQGQLRRKFECNHAVSIKHYVCMFNFRDTIADHQFTVELVAFGGFRASTSGVEHQFYSGQY